MNNIIDLIKENNLKYELLENILIIYNKNSNKFIKIIKETNNEYIVSFVTQHCHLDDIDDVLDYINKIMNDDILPIEFYFDNNRKFGFDISKDLFNNLSINFFEKYVGFDKEFLDNYSYEIHSWSGKYDIRRQPIKNLLKGDKNG